MPTGQVHSLTSRIWLSLLIVAIVPLIAYVGLSNVDVTYNLTELEQDQIQHTVNAVETLFEKQTEDLCWVVQDYAVWDEPYERIEAMDSEWFEENFSSWLPRNPNIEFALVANSAHTVVDVVGLDEVQIEQLLGNPEAQRILAGDYDDASACPAGLLNAGTNQYVLAMSPILKTDASGASRGILIIGRKISPSYLDVLKEDFALDVIIKCNDRIVAPSEYELASKAVDVILDNEVGSVRMLDKTAIAGCSVNTISESKHIEVFTTTSRDIFASALEVIHRDGIELLVIAIILVLVLAASLLRQITDPVKSLAGQIRDISIKGTMTHLDVDGPTEICWLASEFNVMVDRIRAHKLENQHLRALSNTDELTSLFNHRYFFEYTKALISKNGTNFSVLFIDIDHFKLVNDTKGHSTGDLILKQIAHTIQKNIPKEGVVFRYGGEEFTVILEHHNRDQAYYVAEKIRKSLEGNVDIQQFSVYSPITLSIGIAGYPYDGEDSTQVIDRADKALYYAKHNGRNQCHVYTREVGEHFVLQNELQVKQEVLMGSAYALASAIDVKDRYTGRHSESVAKYSLLLAEELELTHRERYALSIGALLHDCGKIGVPDSVINKSGPLSDSEWQVLKNHTVYGYNIVKHVVDDCDTARCVLLHHERWDGKGYPQGKSGEQIPLLARIVCVADSFHAMISDRPYRKALSQEEAIQELKKNAGTQFDPKLVEAFVNGLKREHAEVSRENSSLEQASESEKGTESVYSL